MDLIPKHLITMEQRTSVFDLYHQLNPRLDKDQFEERMAALMHYKNYHVLGVFIGDTCVAISGYWLGVKLYCGAYLEPDNVVVDRNHRSAGIGEFLQQELERIALTNNCEAMMLDAYLENVRGHAFYERHGYARKGYHFVKKLTPAIL